MTLPNNFIRQFLVCVVLSIVFYGVWVAYTGADEVWSSVLLLGLSGWGIILGLSLFNYLLRFIRWDLYLRRLGCNVPVLSNLTAYLAGFGFTTTPGKVGEAIRSVYLKRFGVSYVLSLSAFFVERFVDMIAMIIVASLAAYAFESTRWLVGLTFVVTIALLPLLHSQWLYTFIDHRRQALKSVRLRSFGEHILKMLQISSDLLSSGPLYIGLFLGLCAWAAEGLALYVVLDYMGADTTLVLAVGIYGVSILAGAVSFVPGGLGGTELVMGSLLLLTGVDAPVAASAVIVCRLATLWFAVIIGLVCVVGKEVGDSSTSLIPEK
ncbi:MAG: flippase-like domain-containing protein [Gammaproteobacteria bacterium]|nr:flippase-like domain-containing protein [Gammaproteobacteria bacterium]MCP4089775.1 flippase-like domain-containing protein [Gammaproteobacteria bacterium]MCP4278208.1 flippase-like domain-containing protein [Gammaproteobacteria bacterium]MCP4831927.1 flippase-like domain-containing protein [Gammaproteobacteria bacterium]MCP4927601.1 flippase-like domain-containing protein [Gammaproteobacteria bacterium]